MTTLTKLIAIAMSVTTLFNSTPTEQLVEEAKSNSVTISFVGDCTLGEYKGQSGNTLFRDFYKANGAEYFLSNVRNIFETDDITFVNLEGPLTERSQTVVKEFPIRCESEHVNVLTTSSVEVVNLSNNHIYDCGQAGFEDTKQLLQQNNIGYCGEDNVYTIEKNGLIVTFLGYRGWNNTAELRTNITNDIANAKINGSNVVCVMFHFGEEGKHYSNETQQSLARHAVDSGADIVVGNHPHVIQGIEVYNGKTICYSLGNFCFGANKNPKDKDTFIYQQTFTLTENDIEYSGHNIIPCSISSEKNRNNYQPSVLDESDSLRVLGRLKEYSSKYVDTLEILK